MTPTTVDIYYYRNAVDFLTAVFAARRGKNPRYSLRSWCKHLGLSEPASLSLVLNRKRSISKKLQTALKAALCENEDEGHYFDIIAAAANAEDKQTELFYARIAADFRGAKQPAMARIEEFEVIKGWYHFVILEMTRLADFSEDVEWLYARFAGKVSKHDLRSAMIRLIQLGYLRRQPNGKLERSDPYLKSTTDVPNMALRNLHKEFISQAVTAIDAQDLMRRDVTGFHTATSYEKIVEAKKKIASFRKELMAFLDEPGGDTVYQVNVQMFDLLSK